MLQSLRPERVKKGVSIMVTLVFLAVLCAADKMTPVAEQDGGKGAVHGIHASSDGAYYATSNADNWLTVWECKTDKRMFAYKEGTGPITAIAFPDKKTITIGSSLGVVRFFDLPTGKESKTVTIKKLGAVMAFRLIASIWPSGQVITLR